MLISNFVGLPRVYAFAHYIYWAASWENLYCIRRSVADREPLFSLLRQPICFQIRKVKPLAIVCDYTARAVPHLVENPEDRFLSWRSPKLRQWNWKISDAKIMMGFPFLLKTERMCILIRTALMGPTTYVLKQKWGK